MNKYKLARITLNKHYKTFVIYISTFRTPELVIVIYPSQAPLLAALQQKKVYTPIFLKYVDYVNVFSLNLAMELFQNISINKYIIKLIDEK